MRVLHWTTLSGIIATGLFLAWLSALPTANAAVGIAPQASTPLSFAEEVHAGTFEEPRVVDEPAWKGAVFSHVGSENEHAFYIAAFDSEPDRANPPFPDTPQSNEYWTYAGRHAGTGLDLKPFNEPTRIGALHEGLIEGKRALLRSKIDGTPSAQTPYPSLPETNDFWEFLGVFEKAGTVAEMKDDQDLVWPGAYVLFESSGNVYVALQTGHPVTANWPAPNTTEGANYWKYAGTLSGIPSTFPKPWDDLSANIGSYYVQAVTSVRRYYYGSRFTGFPFQLSAAFPSGAQSNSYWDYRGRHEGSNHDPKTFGESTWLRAIHRARIGDKLATLYSRFSGTPSAQTPYPTTLAGNDYWSVALSYNHAGTWQDPKDAEDVSWEGSIHAQPEGTTTRIYRALNTVAFDPPQGGWDYNNTKEWQALGISVHTGTIADPKGQDELTWPGAVHATTVNGTRAFFVSQMEGIPAEHEWPLPTTAISNEHWVYIPEVKTLGTFEAPRHWADYSQPGSVYVDGTVPGKRTFYISRFEGYPADDIDSFSTVGQADPNWIYAGRHAGSLTDLKPFDEPTYVGAMHESEVEGQRVLLRSRIDGMPSAATPYPAGLASNDYWEFVGVFKHAGTADDLKGRDDLTWPGALHLDETQQIVFAATRQAEPGPSGWVYPTGETSDENWTYVTSLTSAGTAEAPRGRNGLSTPGTIFANQRGLLGRKLYRAKFTGFARDVAAVYPSGTDANEFYEYAGEHAGTFTDPKPFTDPTWPGAIHLATIDGKLAFLKSKITGTPTDATPYPETLASNEFWDFEFSTAQAGTFTDPKTSLTGETWPGAVHQQSDTGQTRLYTALKFGNPAVDNWPSPAAVNGPVGYWKLIGQVRHKGTFQDPKDFTEVTSQGLIHTADIGGETVYLRSLVQGIPAENGWAYPTTDTGNEYWEYLGKNLHEGTWSDPKGADDFTWPGRIHSVWIGTRHLYLMSNVDGLPAEHDWPIPQEEQNAYWSVAGESLHSGDFPDPKGQQEVTWVGAIHMRQDAGARVYFRSKVASNLAEGSLYPLPETNVSNSGWEFVGLATHAGTLADPLTGSEVVWPGTLYKIRRAEQDEYYAARFSGATDTAHPLPASGTSSDNWTYRGKSQWPGTLVSPKDAHEITWPDAIHRFEVEAKAYYVRSKIDGLPPESGWAFPAPPNSDEQWDYLDMGVHAGTWDDPKPWVDATWPGAIHVLKATTPGESRLDPRTYFRSKFWGRPGEHGGTYFDPDLFDLIAVSINRGTLESPKQFGPPTVTWVGAIHFDTKTHFLFEAKKAGELEVDLSAQPTTPTDNDSWHFVGISMHSGTLGSPKDWDEYTWPGRIHRYESGGKVLFFSALMTGTPSTKLWYYPTDESTNDYWAFYGATEHAGTFAAPHQWNEVTWRNAIHRVTQAEKTVYFAAKLPGNSEAEKRPYPTSEVDNLNWRYVATGMHAGTAEDPKNWEEPVWPGAIVKIQRQGGTYYYVAKNDGVPPANHWALPDGASNNENWDYVGVSLHAGTQNDPKEWTEFTWPGAIHDYQVNKLIMFFRAKKAGVPSDNAWNYPSTPTDNDDWHFVSYTDLSGSYDWPKSWNEVTKPGLIHATTLANQRLYFASKFEGQARPADTPEGDKGKIFPDGTNDNQWWEFKRKGNGKATIPNDYSDYSLVGDINGYYYNGKHFLFRAKQEGRPSSYYWYYPTSEIDNSYWEYLYSHAGTFDDPKEWSELTQVDEFHRYEYGDRTLFFKARKEGTPAKQGWNYPTTPIDNEYWTYAGLHAGTRQDPKIWEEPTWPGAIHWNPKNNRYYISNVTGYPPAYNWYYPTTPIGNSFWQNLDTGKYSAPGINDFSKPFDQYTWVTAHNGYLDALQPQLQRGVRGFMLDLHYDFGSAKPTIRMCHRSNGEELCDFSDVSLTEALNNTFLPYLRDNREAVLTLIFESYVTYADMQRTLEAVPGVADYSYDPNQSTDGKWATLQEMISSNKRLVMISSGNTPGSYPIGDKKVVILRDNSSDVENTYNLGNTALTHDWECRSRYGDMALSLRKANGALNRLFVLNQFHAFGSSTAHAGDKDNNLTWLQRRVERYCGEPTGWRKPNYLAIDFNQVGDAFRYAAALSQGGLYFYEGNGADRDRDTTCVLPGGQHKDGNGVEYDMKLPSQGCENDEIRSMELEGISAGTRIELYDSPDADRQDDFTIIDVKQSVPMGKRVRVDSLEGSSENFWYRKLAVRNNGMDGKISRIKVRTTPAKEDFSDALIVFHEEVNAQQNIVCSVPFAQDQRFKMGHGNNSYGCDNDEIDSATIIKAKAGSYFSVTGSPEGGFSQGLAEVRVKKDILTPVVIGNFESNFENEFVKVRRCHGHKLGGKISFGYFLPNNGNGGVFACDQ